MFQKHRLAAARLADDDDRFAALDMEINPGQNLQRTKPFMQIFNRNQI